jgi:endonuclease/exonuclease/phosphatase family metal-dependent hydrolase
MRLALIPIAALLALGACATGPHPSRQSTAADRPLRIASWNLEFLAQKDGTGCEPRTATDYEAMRRIADSLDADVVAFQEAETVAAAARVFDPAHYTIVMEARPGEASGSCGGNHPDQQFIRQAVGFAIKKGVAFDRNADVTSLTLGTKGHAPIRLLGVHLKSGCFSGGDAKACPTLLQQIPALENWIDTAAKGPTRFAVLGDWNRRLAQPGDQVWAEIDDKDPENADLRLADEGATPRCDSRYDSFIDHIVLDKRSGDALAAFAETQYAPGEKHYSDHCPVMVTLAR